MSEAFKNIRVGLYDGEVQQLIAYVEMTATLVFEYKGYRVVVSPENKLADLVEDDCAWLSTYEAGGLSQLYLRIIG